MPRRSSTKDENEMATAGYQEWLRRTEGADDTRSNGHTEKNPAAVALGRLGGLKGGKARAAALSDERKREIARKAAEARWSKKAQPK
jgi:hypothetical protein